MVYQSTAHIIERINDAKYRYLLYTLECIFYISSQSLLGSAWYIRVQITEYLSCYIVIECPIQFRPQIPDMDDQTVAFDPRFSDITESLFLIIDNIVTSVRSLKRVEHQLFYEEEWMKNRFISSVQLDEERVLDAKARLAVVVDKNTKGPLK